MLLYSLSTDDSLLFKLAKQFLIQDFIHLERIVRGISHTRSETTVSPIQEVDWKISVLRTFVFSNLHLSFLRTIQHCISNVNYSRRTARQYVSLPPVERPGRFSD